MATVASVSYNISTFGQTITIPDDDIARLMYYLKCVTVSLGFDILHDDLLDFQRYNTLSTLRKAVVFKSALEYPPTMFIDKIIFKDDEHQIIPQRDTNEFANITTACNVVSVESRFVFGGEVKDVTKVMFYTTGWLDRFYNDPMWRLTRRMVGALHCEHCQGKAGMCGCPSCPREADSECTPVPLSASAYAISLPCTTSTTTPATPTHHTASCDGCNWQNFTGPLFKCLTCDNYCLCRACYFDRRTHAETQHPFDRYELEALRSTVTTITNTYYHSRISLPMRGPAPSNQHRSVCDGCGASRYVGPRYRCGECEDYDLCKGCYDVLQTHRETGHWFWEYAHPEADPSVMPVRRVAGTNDPGTVPPPPPPYEASGPKVTAKPASATPPPLPSRGSDVKVQPSPFPTPTPTPASSSYTPPSFTNDDNSTNSPFFYLSLSITELEAFLSEHDVDDLPSSSSFSDGVSYKEALCKLVWETHVDCMSISELNAFLTGVGVPPAEYKGIYAKREKARAAFDPPPRPPLPATTTPANAQFKKDDELVLTGLSKKEMNGKRGVVQSVDEGARKVTVFVEELGKPFKLKWENVEPWVEELEEDEAEELE